MMPPVPTKEENLNSAAAKINCLLACIFEKCNQINCQIEEENLSLEECERELVDLYKSLLMLRQENFKSTV